MAAEALSAVSAGLVDAPPGLDGAAEVPVPGVREAEEETVDSDGAETVV